MAKASVTVNCSECGAKITKEATRNNRREADSWEDWVMSQKWQCPSCWGKAKRAEEAAKGLIIDCHVVAEMTHIMRDEEAVFRLSFSGDTMPNKDAIKALGYRWDHLQDVGFLGMLSMTEPKKAWQKYVTAEELSAEADKAVGIGAKVGKMPTQMEIDMAVAARQEVAKIQNKRQEETDAKIAELEKPEAPEVWEQKVKGHRCNRKIYGKPGSRKIYIDNTETKITDEEADALETYWEAREKYNNDVNRIKGGC